MDRSVFLAIFIEIYIQMYIKKIQINVLSSLIILNVLFYSVQMSSNQIKSNQKVLFKVDTFYNSTT